MAIIQIKRYQCNRCGHKLLFQSIKNKEEHVIYPKCKTLYWNLSCKNKLVKTKKGSTRK